MQFTRRLEKVMEEVKAQGLQALMLFSPEDVYYLTGFYAHMPWYPADLYRLAPVIVRANDEPIHVTGLVNTLRVKRIGAIKNIVDYNEYTEDGIEILGKLLEKLGLSNARIGFDERKVVVDTTDKLKARCPGIEWVHASDIMCQIRAIKDEDELRLLHQACEINRAGLAAGRAAVKPGVREMDVAAEAEHAMRVRGAERFTEETMVLAGLERIVQTRERASWERVIEDGDCVIMDMGAVYQGYCSDQATTTFAGSPPPEQKELFDLAKQVHEKTVNMIRPGMRAKEVDSFAREQYEKSRIKGAHLPHMVGHGVGLEFHDIPLILPGNEVVLQPNMVFTIEPAVRVPDLGAIRLEEVYRLTETGAVKV